LIEKITKTEFSAIINLVNSAYRGETSKKGWTSEADLLDGYRLDENMLNEIFENPKATLLKYVKNTKIEGCILLEQKNEKVMYLGMLTVNPELQNAGIGKILLKEAQKFAQENHLTAIKITVISKRIELITWYERHGFEKTGQTLPFPQHELFIPKTPLEFVVMRKELDSSI
jgi:ribosomal protein S18 acetylase RimI-like enzyme